MDFITKFAEFIQNIVTYIQELVKAIRAKNDGKDPEYPTFGE